MIQTKKGKKQWSKAYQYLAKSDDTLFNKADLVIIDDAAEWTEEDYEKAKKLLVPVREEAQGVTKAIANEVIARARGKCEQCDRGSGSGVPLQISHTVARGMGGTHGEQSFFIHSADNLKYLCEICHLQLFHHEIVRYNPGQSNEQSCATCWLRDCCIETAVIRGILPDTTTI